MRYQKALFHTYYKLVVKQWVRRESRNRRRGLRLKYRLRPRSGMVDEEVEVTEDAAPLRAIVSLEDLFENIDRSVERYVKMDLYAYCPMIS